MSTNNDRLQKKFNYLINLLISCKTVTLELSWLKYIHVGTHFTRNHIGSTVKIISKKKKYIFFQIFRKFFYQANIWM